MRHIQFRQGRDRDTVLAGAGRNVKRQLDEMHPEGGPMADATPGQPQSRPLPPGVDLLWGRRDRGKRGPRPSLSTDAIVEAAVRVADAEGLEAVSMARVAAEVGYTTMSLYRYVASKEELLALMWNASALGAESLVIEGDDWRSRLRNWAVIQRDMLDRHPWITRMPMAAPPVGPNSLHFVERGMAALDGTGIPDTDRIRIIGMLSSFTLNEARMANDAVRAATAAMEAAARAVTSGDGTSGDGARAGDAGEPGPPETFEALLRELVDEKTYPRLYRLAWSEPPAEPMTERAEFLFGVDRILDGVQALIDRAGH
jgi:AcrR family transcriptional regulator